MQSKKLHTNTGWSFPCIDLHSVNVSFHMPGLCLRFWINFSSHIVYADNVTGLGEIRFWWISGQVEGILMMQGRGVYRLLYLMIYDRIAERSRTDCLWTLSGWLANIVSYCAICIHYYEQTIMNHLSTYLTCIMYFNYLWKNFV